MNLAKYDTKQYFHQAAFKMEVSVLKTLAKYPENFLTLKEIYEGD